MLLLLLQVKEKSSQTVLFEVVGINSLYNMDVDESVFGRSIITERLQTPTSSKMARYLFIPSIFRNVGVSQSCLFHRFDRRAEIGQNENFLIEIKTWTLFFGYFHYV
jgi:midasin (ATPase involved in ribosome maturation)